MRVKWMTHVKSQCPGSTFEQCILESEYLPFLLLDLLNPDRVTAAFRNLPRRSKDHLGSRSRSVDFLGSIKIDAFWYLTQKCHLHIHYETPKFLLIPASEITSVWAVSRMECVLLATNCMSLGSSSPDLLFAFCIGFSFPPFHLFLCAVYCSESIQVPLLS